MPSLKATLRRPLALCAGLAAALVGMYSCSMDATVATDRHGRVVALSALRLESTLPRVALGMLLDADGLALRLRWSLDALAPGWLGSTAAPT